MIAPILAQLDPTNCTESNCLSNLPDVSGDAGSLQPVLAVVFGVFAAVAVLIIIIAAIDFSSSEGDSEKISSAKKTIIYALIGLTIALSAEAIVFTVLGRL
jgi:Type IV secretion system pilin